jgi:hypothetical protein
VVKHASVIGFTECQNIHEANATTDIFTDASIDEGVTIMQNVTNFSG